jgi:hypothetical protein
MTNRTRKPIEERLSKWHTDPQVGIMVQGIGWVPCKLWTGARTNKGYGNIEIDGKAHYTHRVSYAMEHGGIEEGKVLDHLCKRRHCGEPLHLDPVTMAENTRRGDSPVGAIMRAKEATSGHK